MILSTFGRRQFGLSGQSIPLVVANSLFVLGFQVVSQLQKFSKISKFSEAFSPSLRRLLADKVRFDCCFLFEERKSVFIDPQVV